MGKIKKIVELDLVGGTQETDIYPVTSTKAVYTPQNKVLEDELDDLKVSKRNTYTDNAFINEAILGVYVFGGKENIDFLKSKNVTINTFGISEKKLFFDITYKDTDDTVHASICYNDLHNLVGAQFVDLQVMIYILVDYDFIDSKKSGATIIPQPVNSNFLDAKDGNVLAFLDNYGIFDFSTSIFPIVYGGGSILSISFEGNKSKYRLGRLEKPTSSTALNRGVFNVLDDQDRANYIYNTNFKEFTGIKYYTIPLKEEGAVCRVKINWDEILINYDITVNTLKNIYFNEKCYINSGYASKEDLENFSESVYTNLDTYKNEISANVSSNNSSLLIIESSLRDLEKLVSNLNIDEYNKLYSQIISQYNDLSKLVSQNQENTSASISELSDSLSKTTQYLTDLIKQGNLSIKDGSVTLESISESLKSYIESSGGGSITNFPDEVTLTQDKDKSTLKIKDHEKTDYNNLGEKRVYGELPKLTPNTVYKVFNNVKVDKIDLPTGSKFIPSGGLIEGTVIGGESSFIHSSDTGMIQDDVSFASLNASILETLIRNKYNIIFDGKYYLDIESPIEIDYALNIKGGILHFIGKNERVFYFSNNKSNTGFTADGVSFIATTNKYLIHNVDTKMGAIIIDNIIFRNCIFSNFSICRIHFEDIDSNSTKYGINRFIISNCYSECNLTNIQILDCVFWKEFTISNNRFTKCQNTDIYTSFHQGIHTNPGGSDIYKYAEDNIMNTCTQIIENNEFIHEIAYNNTDYCCAVLTLSKKVIFRDNHIENVINILDESHNEVAWLSDCYLSSNEVYFYNNIIKNIATAVPSSQTDKFELGKSEIYPLKKYNIKSVRHYYNNTWTIDKDYLISLGIKIDNVVPRILKFDYSVDIVRWENNLIDIKDIAIKGTPARIVKLSLKENSIYCKEIQYPLIRSKKSTTKCTVEITSNNFVITNTTRRNQIYQQIVSSASNTGKDDIYIQNNKFNFLPFFSFYKADTLRITNNTYLIASPFSFNYNVQAIFEESAVLECDNGLVELPIFQSEKYSTSIYISSQYFGKIKCISREFKTDSNLFIYNTIDSDFHRKLVVKNTLGDIEEKTVVKLDFFKEKGILYYTVNGEMSQIDIATLTSKVLAIIKGNIRINLAKSENNFIYLQVYGFPYSIADPHTYIECEYLSN